MIFIKKLVFQSVVINIQQDHTPQQNGFVISVKPQFQQKKHLELKEKEFQEEIVEIIEDIRPECKCGNLIYKYKSPASFSPGSIKYPSADYTPSVFEVTKTIFIYTSSDINTGNCGCASRISYKEYLRKKHIIIQDIIKFIKLTKKERKTNHENLKTLITTEIEEKYLKIKNDLEQKSKDIDLSSKNLIYLIGKLQEEEIKIREEDEILNVQKTDFIKESKNYKIKYRILLLKMMIALMKKLINMEKF